MARLDLITAKARFSRDYSMYAPDINTEGRLWLRQARHPLLEHLFRERAVSGHGGRAEARAPATGRCVRRRARSCPSTSASGYGFNLLVITGPNTGGKTVTASRRPACSA